MKSLNAIYTDGNVFKHETFESAYGVKGILYSFTYSQNIDWFQKENGSGYCFCFPSETDRRWFFITLLRTDNVVNPDYVDDYMTLISTVKVAV